MAAKKRMEISFFFPTKVTENIGWQNLFLFFFFQGPDAATLGHVYQHLSAPPPLSFPAPFVPVPRPHQHDHQHSAKKFHCSHTGQQGNQWLIKVLELVLYYNSAFTVRIHMDPAYTAVTTFALITQIKLRIGRLLGTVNFFWLSRLWLRS